ncbi:nucleoside hydrolase [Nocardia sp. CA-107356]|uniref:nucleoside hydrolase n=1 Tax=Nocardia sp. CA-107356 TaxID=3239972 RepID=UPI003D8E96FA
MTLPPDSPLVIVTDIGGDTDCALALALAALTEPGLELVITSEEFPDRQRSALARRLLDMLGRSDVRVAPGQVSRNSKYWAASSLLPEAAREWPVPFEQVIAAMCLDHSDLPVRWLGIAGMTELAAALADDATHPQPAGITDRLQVTQMGGAFQYRDPAEADVNSRLDPRAARSVVGSDVDIGPGRLQRVQHLGPGHAPSRHISPPSDRSGSEHHRSRHERSRSILAPLDTAPVRRV